MKARRARSHRNHGFGPITLTACLALATGVACTGGPDQSPPTDVPSTKDAPPPKSPTVSTETPTPRGKPIPPQPVGPYTGNVDTTDVSLLYPMPAAGESTDFVRSSDVGNFGALLPAGFRTTVLDGKSSLDHNAETAPDLSLISLRLDPCSPRAVQAGECRSEVRAVFQGTYFKAAGAMDDPSAGTAASDGAIHVTYDVDAMDLLTMMMELLTLKKANGDHGLQELAPHPILAAQGLAGPFAQGLRNIVLSHLGEDRIARATAFDHTNMEGDAWTFTMFERAGSTLVRATIPTTNVSAQEVSGSATSVALPESNAYFYDVGVKDTVLPLVSYRPEPGSAAAAALQTAYDAALRVQNPTTHNVESTSCANCHIAEGAARIGASVFGLESSSAFTSERSLAYRNDNPTVTNLHAFGYLHRKVSVMQRTANESAVVAAQMESAVAAH